MPLRLLLFYGAIGGLSSVLVQSLVHSLLQGARSTAPAASARGAPDAHWRDVLVACLHVAAGAGIGLLFWLSWGFAALVSVSWWIRGLAFGAACAALLVLPLLLASTVTTHQRAGTITRVAFDCSYTCIAAAVASAWAWEAPP